MNSGKAMDIDQKLYEIIRKYKLDRYYPRYRGVIEARRLISELASKWEDEKIACVNIGRDQQKLKFHMEAFCSCLTDEEKDKITFISCQKKNKGAEELSLVFNWNAYDCKALEQTNWAGFDRIYLISTHGISAIGLWLRNHHIPYISLYDYFASKGVIFPENEEMEYYEFLPCQWEGHLKFSFSDAMLDPVTFELHEQKQRYDVCPDQEIRKMLLLKILFLCLHARNFVLFYKYFSFITKDDPCYELYCKAHAEVNELLDSIKSGLRERKERDIVAFWIDSLSYEEVHEVPFLESLRSSSVWFGNAVTFTLYTSETLRTLFLHAKLLDDDTQDTKYIHKGNSPVLLALEKRGYQAKVIGKGIGSIFEDKSIGLKDQKLYSPSSMRLWEMLRQTILGRTPQFILVHILQETHEPRFSCLLDDRGLSSYAVRREQGCMEVSLQMKFYTDLLGEHASRIYFSDHGIGTWWPRPHIFFSVQGEEYAPHVIDGLFSNIDFFKIIQRILDRKDLSEENLCRDYVEIQGNNQRSGDIAKLKKVSVLSQATPGFSPSFGFRGIVDKEFMYLYFTNHREFLWHRDGAGIRRWYAREEDIAVPSLLARYRSLARTENGMPKRMLEKSYFIALKTMYGSAYERNMKKVRALNDMLEAIPSGNIVVCEGRKSSCELLYILKKTLRERIQSIVDDDPECPCSLLNIPIRSFHDMDFSKVDVVLHAERSGTNILRGKLKVASFDGDVLNVYEYLKSIGILCQGNFWEFEIHAEDFFRVLKEMVVDAYIYILGRNPESSEVVENHARYLEKFMSSQDDMREGIRKKFLLSEEFQKKCNAHQFDCPLGLITKLTEEVVYKCYYYILGREPSLNEIRHHLSSANCFSELRMKFFLSPEFRRKYKAL